jgi:hypothetical protein
MTKKECRKPSDIINTSILLADLFFAELAIALYGQCYAIHVNPQNKLRI